MPRMFFAPFWRGLETSLPDAKSFFARFRNNRLHAFTKRDSPAFFRHRFVKIDPVRVAIHKRTVIFVAFMPVTGDLGIADKVFHRLFGKLSTGVILAFCVRACLMQLDRVDAKKAHFFAADPKAVAVRHARKADEFARIRLGFRRLSLRGGEG